MRLTDARALDPGLVAVAADGAGDQALVERLARWASRWSPLVEVDGADALRLDVSGVAHLFGGEAGLVRDIEARFAGLGLSAPSMVELAKGSQAVGKTLAELNLRGVTGATVLAITRGPRAIVATATEVLQADDRLALAGSREAIDAAREVLAPPVALAARS